MQISYDWLLEYLPYHIEIDELSNILTAIGLEVEAVERIEQIPGNLEGIVVGEVLTCEKHPNADKLNLTTVNIGTETLHIVCGAPNVAKGQKVLVATVGTTLYPTEGDSFQIKAAKIRGEESFGMICAEDEIGTGKSHDGILVLPPETVVGTKAAQYFKLSEPQTAIHIGLTPNRSDAMSHYGVARDVTAYLNHHKKEQYQLPLAIPELPSKKEDLPIEIEIANQEYCKRYAGIIINNVTVKESPEWLQEKLRTIGIKPKNNIVDITNYILHDLGQPLHAFDYSKIKGNQIIVKTVAKDTPFVTLEDKTIKLNEADLMICNQEEAMCIAGVMGGNESAVKENTTTVFLESAWFNPVAIRRTSLRHDIRSDAATHFEKTANIDMVLPALQKAANLIAELGNGIIASDIIDQYPQTATFETVKADYGFIEMLCGKKYGKETVNGILQSLGFEITEQSDTEFTVKVPHYKSDIHQAADIAEEILRIDGLNNVITNNRINYTLSDNKYPTNRAINNKISEWLSNNGLQEIVTNSIINEQYYPEEKHLVKMLNSLTSELNAMRPQLLESGLEVLAHNINRNEKNLALYEIGNVYNDRGNHNYIQQEKLGIWLTGNRSQTQWQSKAVAFDIYYLKGLIESLCQHIGISNIKSKQQENTLQYQSAKKVFATVNVVDEKQLKKFGIKQKVFYAEIDIKTIAQIIATNKIQYQELNKFPSVERDLALVLDKTVQYDAIESATKSLQINELKSFQLFDIYEGEKIDNDKRSWAINYIFQSEDKTLTDKDVEEKMQKLMTTYEQKLNALIRS